MAIGIPTESGPYGMNPYDLGPLYGTPVDEAPAGMRDFQAWSARNPPPGRPEQGLYFPSIAENVGRPTPFGRPIGPGVPYEMAPPPTGRVLPTGPRDATGYFPSIAESVGGGMPLPVGGPLPGGGPAVPTSPTPPGPEVYDPGILEHQPPEVYDPGILSHQPADMGEGVHSAPNAAGTAGWMKALSGFGPARGIPMAGYSASQRYSSTRPEFIYTNPAAASQAARNYEARLGFESAQDQGYRDYLSRIGQTKAATEQYGLQAESARALQQAQLEAGQREGAAARASNERIAGLQLATKQYQTEDTAWQANEKAADRGEQIAAMLNANPLAKVDKKWAYQNPATGKWESAFKRKPRPLPQMYGLPPNTPQIVAGPTTPTPEVAKAAPVAVPTPDNGWDLWRGIKALSGPGAAWELGKLVLNPLGK